ncbi:alpha/beta hydrolase-fold protein [Hymenobacter sp. BT770]|uniref:alpha/beta hydrolase n=1 Tax=Hymenobacter sp. BT770 TaxID=2886942 RepID=UPI001D12D91E|nr:alpha/beta hydrolase-fold protein [Hymenobacter sp. BT770]MCC3153209.1 alpha/beta hydrolase [Hymenobacter sp. BT770]MDO3415317.1 alpha/beta hydrolase-fold protein [Hymenobacter sp. BT770]
MKAPYLPLFLLCALGLAAGPAARAQERPVPLAIGQTFTLASAALGETRRINVYLPPAYADSAASARLPVLYMPDGGLGEDFVHVAGLVQVLTGNGTMRPFILVGIENTERRRDLTGPTTDPEDRKIAPRVGGSAAYRTFIRTELMPLIRQRYRTTAETAIVGESLAGLFVVETWLLEPALFDTYVAFDPSVWWNRGQLVGQADKMLRAYSGPAKTLYVASSRDSEKIPESQHLASVLRGAPKGQLTWYYQPLPAETHATIYHPAALQAFRLVFPPKPRPTGN